MKPGLRKDYEYGRQTVKRLLFMTIVFLVVSFFLPQGSYAQMGLILLSMLCMAGEIWAMLTFCRCPHCGKRIVMGALTADSCPRCHRSLTTGKKVRRR